MNSEKPRSAGGTEMQEKEALKDTENTQKEAKEILIACAESDGGRKM